MTEDCSLSVSWSVARREGKQKIHVSHSQYEGQIVVRFKMDTGFDIGTMIWPLPQSGCLSLVSSFWSGIASYSAS